LITISFNGSFDPGNGNVQESFDEREEGMGKEILGEDEVSEASGLR
jgi:hypothetical protein